MSFYFFRVPSLQVTAAAVLGGGSLVMGYAVWDAVWARRNAVPLFNSAAVVRTEESARYPCQRLRGFDVVVRSYYVATEDTSATPRAAAPTPLDSVTSRLRRIGRLFSNDTHRVSGNDQQSATDDAAVASLRVVVRDERDAAAATPASDARPLIAAAHWPPHTAKYAALVLQPSPSGQSSGGDGPPSPAPAAASSRSLLRQLADGATHQSLVRCNPRSVMADMACEGEASYLGAPYLRVLLSGFLLLPATLSQLNVAVLGVGGGSLPLFLQEFFASRIHRCDLVDIEPACFRAAVEQLGLKEELNAVAPQQSGGGVHYHVEDAVTYLQKRVGSHAGSGGSAGRQDCAPPPLQPSQLSSPHGSAATAPHRSSTPVFFPVDVPPPPLTTTTTAIASSTQRQRQLDLLFVDLFVGSELDDAVTSMDFLRLCRSALSPHGVAAFNLPAADRAFSQRCGAVFGSGNVFRIPVPASSNEVVLVRGGAGSPSGMAGPELSHRHLFRRAQELTAQYRLPYDLANHYPLWWRWW